MTPIRIFISSVQREFAREREQLRVYLRGDPLMRHFFEVFLFEDVSASDRRPDEVEKLRVAHQSVPGNPLLAESMYLMRYIEKMGTGTVDMIRRCAEAGLPEPDFEVGSGFVTRIWRTGHTTGKRRDTTQETSETTQEIGDTTQDGVDSHPDTTQENGGTDRGTTQERLLALPRSDPSLTRDGLAVHLGITPDGVKCHLDKLRRAGRIRHVGPTRRGRWEILEPDNGHEA